MSQQVDGNTKAFTTGEAVEAFRRVKLDGSGNIVYSDSGDDWIGTTEEAVAISLSCSVRLRTASGTRKITAAGAFSINALLYGADDGKVDDVAIGQSVFRAIEAATATGDIVEAIQAEDISIAAQSIIWVSPDGDAGGDGSFSSPLLTITAALAAATATRKKIFVMAGDYEEAALTWPEINGLELSGVFGEVTVSLTTPAVTPVLTIEPLAATATFEVSINDIDIKSNFDAGVALYIDNTHITKKLNVYLKNVGLPTKNVTDSSLVVVNGAGAGQAIRVYATGQYNVWEGLVDFTAADTGDRLRIYNHRIIGTVTMNEAVASELTLISVGVAADPTVHSDTLQTQINCWHESDADPNVYTTHANAFSA